MAFVLCFDEVDKTVLGLVGGKGANLGELTKAGFPVPQGFCVTTSAYEAFLQTSSEINRFFDQLEQIEADNLEEVHAIGEEIRKHLESLPIPSAIEAAILEAWVHIGEHKAYAVRSSATAEDLPTASFAGQQDTYLNVRGHEQLMNSVRRCWASLFTDRAISYRAKNGFRHREVLLSVVVQEMVFPEVSGIMFTADPISGNRKITAIDASFGLGEALVSGLVSADLYQVRQDVIVQKKVSSKKVAVFAVEEGGTVTKELSAEQQDVQALTDEQIIDLAQLGRKVEDHYGVPQDIEWCLVKGQFYLVQSRPITSLYPVPRTAGKGLRVFFSVGHQQMMTNALSPLGISVLRTLFPFAKSGSLSAESPAVVEAGGHLFFDPTDLLYLKPARRLLPKLLRNVDERIGSAIEEVVHRPDFRQPVDKRVKQAVFRIIRTGAKVVLPRLFTKDLGQIQSTVNRFIEQQVQQTEQFIFEATGAKRIRRIQESLGSVILLFVRNVGPHMFMGVASMMLTNALVKKWLGDDERVHVLNKSLRGNVTSELGLMLGDLADVARQYPDVLEYLQTAQNEAFFEGLYRVQGGKAFGQAFEQFTVQYGMRCPGEIDIANLRWRESPTMLVPAIMSHIRTMTPGEHRTKFKQGEIEAEDAAKGILADLRRMPMGFMKAKILSRLIKLYRNLAGLREHPKYFIIQHFGIYKRALLEEASVLVEEGKLCSETDIFYLSLREVLALCEHTLSGDVRELVRDRKWQHAQNMKLVPPRVMTSEGEIVTGNRGTVEAPEGALIGTPVSSGVVEGYARIVLRPEEAKLEAGEIMVAPFTDPGWTPLFHSAKALVMEVGGMMTHGAVVAREYGIPAVVGIDDATKIIQNGDYVRVDGTLGYVQVIQECMEGN